MKLTLISLPSANGCTVGDLYVNGAWQCFTLEDEVREAKCQAVSSWKIPGNTAIPAGTYNIIVNMSQRFQRMMPLLLDVPGFDGVRIHMGNTAADTEGCILVGQRRNPNSISGSLLAYNALFSRLDEAFQRHEPITIEIVRKLI